MDNYAQFDSVGQVDETARTQRFVWRIAAILLSIITLTSIVLGLLDPTEMTGRQWIYQAINLILVFGLFSNKPWAYAWTLLRAVLAVGSIVVVFVTDTGIGMAWVDAILFLMIVIVLIGKPNRLRAILGAALFGIVFVGVFAVSVLTTISESVDPAVEQVSLGFQHLEQDHPMAAAQVLERVIEDKPDLAEAHIGLGLAYISLNRNDDALTEINRAIDLAPTEAEFWGLRARFFAELDRYEEGLYDADQAILLEPDEADYHHWRATCLMGLERYDEALVTANRALELNGDDPMIYVTRGWVFAGLGNNALAKLDFEEAIRKLPPDDPGIPELEAIIEYITN